MFALYAPNIYIFIFCINIIYESYLQIFLYLCTTFESPNLKEKERRTFYFLEEEMPQIVSETEKKILLMKILFYTFHNSINYLHNSFISRWTVQRNYREGLSYGYKVKNSIQSYSKCVTLISGSLPCFVVLIN
jgi:hypothetical protein